LLSIFPNGDKTNVNVLGYKCNEVENTARVMSGYRYRVNGDISLTGADGVFKYECGIVLSFPPRRKGGGVLSEERLEAGSKFIPTNIQAPPPQSMNLPA
jgi:hypothetical protein